MFRDFQRRALPALMWAKRRSSVDRTEKQKNKKKMKGSQNSWNPRQIPLTQLPLPKNVGTTSGNNPFWIFCCFQVRVYDCVCVSVSH